MQSHSTPAPSENELCPNCGTWVESLDSTTGWCLDCSPIVRGIIAASWLFKNANHVEHYMVQGFSVTKSASIAAERLRPVCVVCSEEIPRAKRGSIFCRRYEQCRRFQRRYVHLYTRKGYTKTEALAQILQELSD
jgi:hypothetical protein